MKGELNTSAEKRKHPRLSMYLPLQFEVMDEPYVHKGSVVNASNGGFLIHSTHNLPLKMRVNITILFPRGFEINNFRLVGEIVWGKVYAGMDHNTYQYGLRCVSITEEDRKKLTALLCGRPQKDPKKSQRVLGFEMRRHPRFPVDYPIEYYRQNSPVKIAGRVMNISERGVGVALRERAEIGQHLKVNVLVGSESGPSSDTLDMVVQVVWLDVQLAEGWGDYHAGAKIIDVSPENGGRLRDLIESLQKNHLRHVSSENSKSPVSSPKAENVC